MVGILRCGRFAASSACVVSSRPFPERVSQCRDSSQVHTEIPSIVSSLGERSPTRRKRSVPGAISGPTLNHGFQQQKSQNSVCHITRKDSIMSAALIESYDISIKDPNNKGFSWSIGAFMKRMEEDDRRREEMHRYIYGSSSGRPEAEPRKQGRAAETLGKEGSAAVSSRDEAGRESLTDRPAGTSKQRPSPPEATSAGGRRVRTPTVAESTPSAKGKQHPSDRTPRVANGDRGKSMGLPTPTPSRRLSGRAALMKELFGEEPRSPRARTRGDKDSSVERKRKAHFRGTVGKPVSATQRGIPGEWESVAECSRHATKGETPTARPAAVMKKRPSPSEPKSADSTPRAMEATQKPRAPWCEQPPPERVPCCPNGVRDRPVGSPTAIPSRRLSGKPACMKPGQEPRSPRTGTAGNRKSSADSETGEKQPSRPKTKLAKKVHEVVDEPPLFSVRPDKDVIPRRSAEAGCRPQERHATEPVRARPVGAKSPLPEKPGPSQMAKNEKSREQAPTGTPQVTPTRPEIESKAPKHVPSDSRRAPKRKDVHDGREGELRAATKDKGANAAPKAPKRKCYLADEPSEPNRAKIAGSGRNGEQRQVSGRASLDAAKSLKQEDTRDDKSERRRTTESVPSTSGQPPRPRLTLVDLPFF